MIGKNVKTLIPKLAMGAKASDQLAPPRRRRRHAGLSARRELAGCCRDGSTFPIDLVISEIRLEDRPTFAIIARNVSERRALEKEALEASTREQRRISRDLHDRVGQELTGLGYLAASLRQELGPGAPGEVAAKIVSGIGRIFDEVRSAIRGLTPVATEDNGLMTALEELATRTQATLGIPCRFVSTRPLPIKDNRIATHLFFIAQEAVHNAVKHARAAAIVIALQKGKDHVTLEVSDDGVGIGPDLDLIQSMGLHIMRYRAGEIGARIAIGNVDADGRGTRVTCTLPRRRDLDRARAIPPPGNTIARILIVDDHPVVREGLSALISGQPDLSVCGQAEGCAQAIALVDATKPDLVIVDISLKDGNGIELIKRLKSRDGSLQILVSSMHDEGPYAERSLRAGAMGYVSKQESSHKIVAAIHRVLDGKVYLSERMADKLLHNVVSGSIDRSPIESLADRELQVFEMIGQGLNTRQIAAQLHLSHKTVETYRGRIRTKLTIGKGLELTRHAIQWIFAVQQPAVPLVEAAQGPWRAGRI